MMLSYSVTNRLSISLKVYPKWGVLPQMVAIRFCSIKYWYPVTLSRLCVRLKLVPVSRTLFFISFGLDVTKSVVV